LHPIRPASGRRRPSGRISTAPATRLGAPGLLRAMARLTGDFCSHNLGGYDFGADSNALGTTLQPKLSNTRSGNITARALTAGEYERSVAAWNRYLYTRNQSQRDLTSFLPCRNLARDNKYRKNKQ
jgi:hypothetical protein